VDALSRSPSAGVSSPSQQTVFETSVIPLADVMRLYERDPTCKSSVDLLSAATVGIGFYTTCKSGSEKAKQVIDDFNEEVNLDGLLNQTASRLIACGNDFWLKLVPDKLEDLRRLPIDAIEKIQESFLKGSNLKVPYKVEGYKLKSSYGGGSLDPKAVLHWSIGSENPCGFGIGVLQVLLHTLTINNDKRPSYAWMKAKIERLMPKIFERYAAPDVVVQLEGQKEDTIKKFETKIRNRSEEGAWIFSGAKTASVNSVAIDPRASGFAPYIDHMVNQFYLGCETPLPRLFSTPGFTEASANAALDLQSMLIKPLQRYIKRQVEREIFASVLSQSGFNPAEAKVRLNWGSPETPEIMADDLIKAAEKGFIREEEFRKNAVKVLNWELWDEQPKDSASQPSEGGENRH